MHPGTSLRHALLTVSALLFGYSLLQMGNTLQGTLLALRGSSEGFPSVIVGLLNSAFCFGLVAGALTSGRIIERVGHTRVFAALASIASAAALLHLMVVHPVAWLVFRMATGVCFAGLFVVVESWLNGASTSEMRGRVVGVYAMSGLLAGIIGQLLLPFGDSSGYILFCLVSVIISLALVPVALSQAQAPGSGLPQARIDLERLYRQSPFGVLAAPLCGLSTAAFFGLGPLYAHGLGLDITGIAKFMAAATAGALVCTWPFGLISDRMDRRRLIVAIAGLAAVLQLVLLVFAPVLPAWALLPAIFVFGGLVIPGYSLVIAHVNDKVPHGELVAAASGLLVVQGIGATLGPLAAGLAMDILGPAGLTVVVLAAQCGIVALGLVRISRAAPAPMEAHEEFVPIATPQSHVVTDFSTPAPPEAHP